MKTKKLKAPALPNKESVARRVRSLVILTFGLFLNAFAWSAFLIPGKIVGGGLTGLATLIFYATQGWGMPIPVSVSYLVMNVFLIALAIRILGASFGIKTVFSVLLLSFFLGLLQNILPKEGIMEADPFLFAVIGGALAGAGIGIVFTQGGSTGGTDIIAMIITKYRNISPGRLILYMDVFIISLSFLVFREVSNVVYGFVTMAVVSYTIDLIIEGQKQSVQVFIFSRHHAEISEILGQRMHRGITFLDGQGWFTREKTKIVLVITRKHELPSVLGVIKSVDPDAFVSVGSVMGTYGKGFESIRN